MDTATATIIAAFIGASASIIVALITTRPQIGGHQTSSGDSFTTSGHAPIINDTSSAASAAPSTPSLSRFISYCAIVTLDAITVFFGIGVSLEIYRAINNPVLPGFRYPISLFLLLIMFLTLSIYLHKRLRATSFRFLVFLLVILSLEAVALLFKAGFVRFH